MRKFVYPQEIIVWNIIPYLRKEIALEMIKKGIEQKKIATYLTITEAAVSQYVNDKRAYKKFNLTRSIKMEISNSADKIISKKSDILIEIQRLLSLPELKAEICLIHKKDYGASINCQACLMGAT